MSTGSATPNNPQRGPNVPQSVPVRPSLDRVQTRLAAARQQMTNVDRERTDLTAIIADDLGTVQQAPVAPVSAADSQRQARVLDAESELANKGSKDVRRITAAFDGLQTLANEHRRPENSSGPWFEVGNPDRGVVPGKQRYVECRKSINDALNKALGHPIWQVSTQGTAIPDEMRALLSQVNMTIDPHGDFPGDHPAIDRLVQAAEALLSRMQQEIRSVNPRAAAPQAAPAVVPVAPVILSPYVEGVLAARYTTSVQRLTALIGNIAGEEFWNQPGYALRGVDVYSEAVEILQYLQDVGPRRGLPNGAIDVSVMPDVLTRLNALHAMMIAQTGAMQIRIDHGEFTNAPVAAPVAQPAPAPVPSAAAPAPVVPATQPVAPTTTAPLAPTAVVPPPPNNVPPPPPNQRTTRARVGGIRGVFQSRLRTLGVVGLAGVLAVAGVAKLARYNPETEDPDFDKKPAAGAKEEPGKKAEKEESVGPKTDKAKPSVRPSTLPAEAPAPAKKSAERPLAAREVILNLKHNIVVKPDGGKLILTLPKNLTQIRFGAPKKPIHTHLFTAGGTQEISIPADAAGADYLAVAIDVADGTAGTWEQGSFVKVPLK